MDAQNLIVFTYVSYVLLSVCLTIWVARTLHNNGRVFLIEVFGGDESLADSVNHLLVVGFYLINLGYVSLALKIGINVDTPRVAIEALSYKIGSRAARAGRNALLQPPDLPADPSAAEVL
jgi:hypothetical protein